MKSGGRGRGIQSISIFLSCWVLCSLPNPARAEAELESLLLGRPGPSRPGSLCPRVAVGHMSRVGAGMGACARRAYSYWAVYRFWTLQGVYLLHNVCSGVLTPCK